MPRPVGSSRRECRACDRRRAREVGSSVERMPAVVIGAGQAGLSASHELTARGVPHVILDRGAVGHTWRTRRWRSFHIVSPNSLNLLPGYDYDGPEPDAFMDTAGLLEYLDGYAASFGAPIRTGIEVREVHADRKSVV